MNQFQDLEDSSSEESLLEEKKCLGAGLCSYISYSKSINIISKDKVQVLIEIIEKIENGEIKRQYLTKLKDIIEVEEKVQKIEVETCNFQEIVKRFKPQIEQEKFTIRDLQEEIKNFKEEIQQF